MSGPGARNRFRWRRIWAHWLDRLPSQIAFATLGLLWGLVTGWLLTQWSLGDRLVIGGTGQELSLLLDTGGQRVVIGGGASRSDLVDFVDRSTLPWDRQVDLLVVPAWDERHLPGSLELLQRGRVRQLALLGLPGNDPSWTRLERAAQARDTTVIHVTVAQRVTLGDTAWMTLQPAPAMRDDTGVCLVIRLGQIHIAVVDATGAETTHWEEIQDAHLLVALRRPSNDVGHPPLLAQPAPRRPSDFVSLDADYELALDRGQRVTLRFSDRDLWLPLEALEKVSIVRAHRDSATQAPVQWLLSPQIVSDPPTLFQGREHLAPILGH